MGERPWLSKIIAALLILGLLALLSYMAPRALAAPQPRRQDPRRDTGGLETQVGTIRPLYPHDSQLISAPAEVFGTSTRNGANNCLFEAVINAGRIRSPVDGQPANPQLLRELCMRALKEDPLGAALPNTETDTDAILVVDAVADGQVTGGEFLAILSKLLRIKIHVNIVGSTGRKGWMPEPIAYDAEIASDRSAPVVHIRHIGDADSGHWEASPQVCPNVNFGCVEVK